MDIKITRETLPVIEVNYDEVKSNLEESMAKYKNIVVSEETLKDCKATQRDLNKLAKQIDEYRKEKKKAFSAPIKEFEGKCKELISIIDEVLLPIKEGVSEFDEKKKAAKRAAAADIIKEMADASTLAEKFKGRIENKSEYSNVAATIKSVRTDVQNQISYLETVQALEDEKRKGVQACIDDANKRITKKLKVEDFEKYIDSELSDIINEVNKTADLIYEAEHPVETPEEPAQTEDEAEKITMYYELYGDPVNIQRHVDKMRADGIEVEAICEEALF